MSVDGSVSVLMAGEAVEMKAYLRRQMDSDAMRSWFKKVFGFEANRVGTVLGLGQEAETFYWSAPLCDLLQSSSFSIPDWTLEPDMLPAPQGFFRFERPVGADGNENGSIVALSWTTVYEHEGGRFSIFNDTDGVGAKALEFTLYSNFVGEDGGTRILPSAVYPWEMGRGIVDVIDDIARSQPDLSEQALGWKRRRFQIIAAAFSFLSQRLVVADREPTPRAVRKRLGKAGVAHDVTIRIVRLRVQRREGTERSANAPEWSCRWIVRGHWRQQSYRGGMHKPIWITPYIKGPSDKPVKAPTTTVFAVVR